MAERVKIKDLPREEYLAYRRKISAAYRKRNPEKVKELVRKAQQKNPEIVKRAKAKWKKANPDADKNRHLIRKYGITIEQYNEMHDRQQGLCAICKQPESKVDKGTKYKLAVDHNHTTGQVRELLCMYCNNVLGLVEKRKIPIQEIEKYLLKHNQFIDDTEADCG